MKVIVIGGGPAGMMAAITAAKQGNEVILLEKMKTLGRKLLITGKGRCNITSSLEMEDFIKNIPGNGRFLYSAFQRYTNKDIIQFLQKHSVKVKEERGNRIFPVSDKSIDILEAFQEEMKKNRIIVKTEAKVTKILIENQVVVGIEWEQTQTKKQEKIFADKIILATGGKSYPATGSTGDGYTLAKMVGHTITEIRPSLVPLEISAKELVECKQMQGLSLRNVRIKLIDRNSNKLIYHDFGEMLFTHFGVSGPTILSGSAHLVRYKQVKELMRQGELELEIDLKPALSEEKLEARILRDFEQEKNKEYKNSLIQLLPQKMIPIIIQRTEIEPSKKVNEITKQERGKLVETLKKYTLKISNFRPIEEAIITAGGISIKEINPKTMESKVISHLYFAGEVMDVDAYTGGFNLQIAYSTGYVAGSNKEEESYGGI